MRDESKISYVITYRQFGYKLNPLDLGDPVEQKLLYNDFSEAKAVIDYIKGL